MQNQIKRRLELRGLRVYQTICCFFFFFVFNFSDELEEHHLKIELHSHYYNNHYIVRIFTTISCML